MPDIQTVTHGPIDVDGLPLGSQAFMTGTSIEADGNAGAGAALTVTLPAVASVVNYLCGIQFTFGKASTFSGLVAFNINGLASGSMRLFTWQDSSTFTTQTIVFNPPLPASAVNMAISAVTGGVAGGGAPAFTLWGFYA